MKTEFDEIIENKLGIIPKPTTLVDLKNLEKIELSEDDKKTFSLLYSLKPTTLDGRANSNTIGNGEIAVYWFLKYSGNEVNFNSKNNSKLPDLTINDIGFEIKAYEKRKQIEIGRISKKQNGDLLEMLNICFTLSTIVEYSKNKTVDYSTLSINSRQLEPVFHNIVEIINSFDLWKDKVHGQSIQNMINRLGQIYINRCNITPKDSNDLIKFFISELVKDKMKLKPGIGGYIINVHSDGNTKFKQITQELIDSDQFIDNCLKYAQCYSGALRINVDKIFT